MIRKLVKALDEALREELELKTSAVDVGILKNGATAGRRWASVTPQSKTAKHIELAQQVATLQLTGSGPKSG